jgi:toxin ParE1/3/4
MARVIRREAARRDLIRHFAYLGEYASLEIAEEFLLCVERSFSELSKMPQMGSLVNVTPGKFSGSRLWPVRDFQKYLIVYRPLADGVRIERVLHAAQDYQRLLR